MAVLFAALLCLSHCKNNDNGGSPEPPTCTPTTTQILSAKLTVAEYTIASVLRGYGYAAGYSAGILDPSSFSHKGIDYEVIAIAFLVQSGDVTEFFLTFDNIPELSVTDEWTLEFGSTSLALKDRDSYSGFEYRWSSPSFPAWSDGDVLDDVILSAPSCD